ncbi:MAG TPA: hypothetical protein VF457_01990 [Burkholderiaceae bacterium]
MVFAWFNTRAVDAFVDAEVAEILRRVPPAKLEGAGAKKAQDTLDKLHDQVLQHTRDFVRREKPNLFKKARLANRMKWALQEAKYPASFVGGLAYALAAVAASAQADREI